MTQRIPYRGDVVTIPLIWVMFVLSLLLHLLVLWQWLPQMRTMSFDTPDKGDTPLAVRMTAPPTPARTPPVPQQQAAAPAPPPPVPPAKQEPKPRPALAPRPRPTPPQIARAPLQPPPPVLTQPGPSLPAPIPPAPTPPVPAVPAPPAPPAAPPMQGDLSSYIAERRRARGEADAPPRANLSAADVENARRDRAIAENLASLKASLPGEEPKNSGGLFTVTRLGFNDADVTFYGWNKDIRRRAAQKLEIQKGDSSDIKVAVVRRIIQIIREYEQGDFSWESRRLGRTLVLSAREQDTAGLEDFMMLEFFDDPRRIR